MSDILSVELEILEDKATVKIDRFAQKLGSLNSEINSVGKNAPFAAKLATDFDALEKKSNDLRQAFQSVSTTRLDAGNIGHLTKEIVAAHERAGQLSRDIVNIRRELAAPHRKSSIAFLTDELKAAERESDSLNRKLLSVRSPEASASRTKGERGGGGRGRVTDAQSTFLELTDDFAPAGFNRPFNAAARGMFAVNAISTTTLATFGAIAAVGYGIVKVTQNIREEAERQLKVQEQIQGAINKQILGQQQALKDFREVRENAAFDRQFNRDLQSSSIDELKRRRATVENLISLTPQTINDKPNENFQRLQNEILAFDRQINQLPFDQQKSANDAFNQRFENYKKAQENAIAAEKAFLEKRRQFSKSLLSLKDDFRETLFTAQSKDNPFLKSMFDIETATERAQAKFGAFGDSVVKKIADIEKADLTKAIGLQRFENNSDALKFSQQARKLEATPERQFADFQRSLDLVERKVDFTSKGSELNRRISEADFYADKFNPNNPKSFAQFNRRGANDDVSDVGLQIRNAVSDIASLKNIGLEETGLLGRESVVNKILDIIPPREELLKRLDNPSTRFASQSLLNDQSEALRIKKDIDRRKFTDFLEDQKTSQFGKQFASEQIGLINNNKLFNDAEKARRRLSVTDALGNDLNATLKRQRIQDFTTAAGEKLNQEKVAIKNTDDIKKAVEAIAKGLLEHGIKIDVSNLPVPVVNVKVETKDNNTDVQLAKSATSADTAAAYQGLSFYDENEIRQTLRGNR